MESTESVKYFWLTPEQRQDVQSSWATYYSPGSSLAFKPPRLYRAVPSAPNGVLNQWETALLRDDEFWQLCEAPDFIGLDPINWHDGFYTPHQLTTQLLHTHVDALRLIMSESLQPGIGDFTKKHVNVFGVTAASLIEAVCDALGVNCAKV